MTFRWYTDSIVKYVKKQNLEMYAFLSSYVVTSFVFGPFIKLNPLFQNKARNIFTSPKKSLECFCFRSTIVNENDINIAF